MFHTSFQINWTTTDKMKKSFSDFTGERLTALVDFSINIGKK